MSRWVEQLKNHPIHESLRQLEEWGGTEFDDISEEELIERKRFIKVLELHKNVLQTVDADIVPFNQLDGLNNQLRSANIWNQVQSYSKNNNITHLQTANNHLSTQLTQLCLLIPLIKNGEKGPKGDDSTTFEYALRALIKKKEEIEYDYKNLKSVIESSGVDIVELTATIEERKKETDASLSQWQQQFSDAQEKRSESYNEWKNIIDKEVKEQSRKITTDTEKDVVKYKEKIEGELTQLKNDAKTKHNDILELYELASGDSISGGYAQTANKESRQSNLWRFLSFVFIIAAVIWLYTAYKQSDFRVSVAQVLIENSSETIKEDVSEKSKAKSENGVPISGKKTGHVVANNKQLINDKPNFNNTASVWQHFLLSFSLTGVLLFGAGYAARQAHSHRTTEQKTRWFALQIKALDPYISSMEAEDQKEIKKQLAEKFFNGVEQNSDDIKVFDSDTPSSLINSVTNLVKQVK